MFIELVDVLRCTAAHEDTWLVASADRMQGRYIVDGSLGCPICRARFPIHGGIANFTSDAADAHAADADAVAAPDATVDASSPRRLEDDDADGEALRLAALLDLREPGQRVLLAGSWASLADGVLSLVAAELLLVDPPAGTAAGAGRSVLRSAPLAAPLAAGAMHGAALDDAAARDARRAEGIVRAVRPRGRLVGPVGAPVPDGVRELTRDARHWVGEREAPASAPVALQLSRGRRPG